MFVRKFVTVRALDAPQDRGRGGLLVFPTLGYGGGGNFERKRLLYQSVRDEDRDRLLVSLARRFCHSAAPDSAHTIP